MSYIDIRTTKVWSISSIYIYTLLPFLFVKYTIHNDTGRLLGIVLHQVDRLVWDHADITQYSYYRDYFRSSIDYIAFLPTLWGEHRVFVIAIQKCKYTIFILGILRFGVSHQYLYAWIIFLFVKYSIQNNTGWLLVL